MSEYSNRAQEYIVLDNPLQHGDTDPINVVSLKDLQRNINNPEKASKRLVPKNDLTVIGENLESYVLAWNKED